MIHFLIALFIFVLLSFVAAVLLGCVVGFIKGRRMKTSPTPDDAAMTAAGKFEPFIKWFYILVVMPISLFVLTGLVAAANGDKESKHIRIHNVPTFEERLASGDGEFCKGRNNWYTKRCSLFRFQMKVQTRNEH